MLRLPPFAAAAGHVPGCLLRKGGDVPGKEVSGANGRLTSLPFGAGSFALPAGELRFAGSRLSVLFPVGTEEVQALLQRDVQLRNAAGGRILEKRKRSPLPLDSNPERGYSNPGIQRQQRSEEPSTRGVAPSEPPSAVLVP
ncbi:hypothetical protein B4V02_21220 [Paenibacillus kribbensis]|uniref:Uncharacterized protein n=1 Tax=Paenibacillus kribbensis TaxID=172713 RepID=A0A222WS69_9BACL|nr:hypothetical protein [Paenibacillus kribbensis]ASR49036.1 hypothetical protein B4V02_21220 [Paenibacillus kribbensis]